MQHLGPLSSSVCPVVIIVRVLFDHSLSFNTHIKSLVKSCFFHLRNISNLRAVVSQASLIHSVISSRIDYCVHFLQGYIKTELWNSVLWLNCLILECQLWFYPLMSSFSDVSVWETRCCCPLRGCTALSSVKLNTVNFNSVYLYSAKLQQMSSQGT